MMILHSMVYELINKTQIKLPSIVRHIIFIAMLLQLHMNVSAQDIYIVKDTIVNNTWTIPAGAILKFGSKGHISGKGTIRGGIIDAPITQWIFDTTLTIQPDGTYGKDFSARWFGAGRFKDNSNALQKSINTVLE